jgi:hypothetical protein
MDFTTNWQSPEPELTAYKIPALFDYLSIENVKDNNDNYKN